jgi:hypothetical protein
MQKLLIILSLALSAGCASKKTIEQDAKGVKFDGVWGFCEVVAGEPNWACLQHDDVVKLRKLLLECRQGK